MNDKNKYFDIEASSAFLCDIEGNFLLANKSAEVSSHVSLVKTNISEYISSTDALRYDLTMKSKKPRPFIAAAKIVCGSCYFAVIPHNISDCRFAAVAILNSAHSASEFIASADLFTPNDIRFLCEKIESTTILNDCYHTNAVFDAKKAIRMLMSEINANNPTSLSFNFLCQSDEFMCDVGLNSFISIMIAIIFVLNKVSASSPVEISAKSTDEAFTVAFETEIDHGFISNQASTKKKLDLEDVNFSFLRFASECSDCRLDVSLENSRLKISSAFSNITDDLDFKSSSPMANFGEMLKKSIAAISAIYKEEAQE